MKKLKNYRKIATLLFLSLCIFTIPICLNLDCKGPFDARDYSRVAGMRIEQRCWEVVGEPFFSPFLILGGAPDFKTACISLVVWLLLGIVAWGIYAGFRAQRNGAFTRDLLLRLLFGGTRTALLTLAVLALLLFSSVTGRLPGWRLVSDDPNLIVADLHCHTTKSRDAIVSLKTNLEWHESCGYNLVALTEHDQLFSHEDYPTEGLPLGSLPAIICGVEAHTGKRAMLLGLCRDPIPFERQTADESPDRSAWFCKKIHEECGGVVIAETLKRLEPGDIARLADDGVDAFEIVNSGHPEMRPDLRREVLDTCGKRGLPLVAVTDWHGWTGLARTWTVVRAPGGGALSHTQKADLVIRKLREHDSKDIIPVVVGRMGDPSPVRAIFSPFIEPIRYAGELSAAGVISWWIWVFGVFGLWVLLDRKGFPAADILIASLICITGLLLIFAGISLYADGAGSSAAYPVRIGSITVVIGLVACGGGLSGIRRGLRTQWRSET